MAPWEEENESESESELESDEESSSEEESESEEEGGRERYKGYGDDEEEEEEEEEDSYGSDGDSEEDSDEESEDEEEKEIRRIKEEIASLPFHERIRAEESHANISAKKKKEEKKERLRKIQEKKREKRENAREQERAKLQEEREREREERKRGKNEPAELSSKIKVPKVRQVIHSKPKAQSLDPRFNELHGYYNEDLFRKSYSFVNDIQKGEVEDLERQIKKTKNQHKKEQLIQAKGMLVQKLQNEQKVAKMKQAKQEYRREESERVALGKKPFYQSGRQLKEVGLKEKYEQLKRSGKVDQYLAQKRKRTAASERKQLPERRMFEENETRWGLAREEGGGERGGRGGRGGRGRGGRGGRGRGGGGRGGGGGDLPWKRRKVD